MNTANNQIYESTEKKIHDAFLALSRRKEKLTVSAICKEANIHRTTFYSHYIDIVDLENKIAESFFFNEIQKFYNNENWFIEEGLLSLLTFYYDNQNLITRIVKNNTDLQSMFLRFSQVNSLQDIPYKTHLFYSAGVFAILIDWIYKGFKETPQELSEILLSVMKK